MTNLQEILNSYNSQGNHDRDLLMMILSAKKAEDEYQAAIINARTEYSKSIRLQYFQQLSAQQQHQLQSSQIISPPLSPNDKSSNLSSMSNESRSSSPSYNRKDVINALKYKFQSTQSQFQQSNERSSLS